MSGDLRRERAHLRHQRLRLRDRVAEADAQRLVGVDGGAGIDQLARARHADAAGEPLGAAESRDDAEPDLGLPNFALRAA